MPKELTQQADRPSSSALSAANCEEQCHYGHQNEVWLASADCWFCNGCMVDYWMYELNALIPPEIRDDCTIVVYCDSSEEFTHVRVAPKGSVKEAFEITLAQLNAARKAK